jgi:hypothetical protein
MFLFLSAVLENLDNAVHNVKEAVLFVPRMWGFQIGHKPLFDKLECY